MRIKLSAVLPLGALVLSCPAMAQEIIANDMSQQAQTLTVPPKDDAPKDAEATSEKAENPKKAEFLIVPIPVSNPAFGTGAMLAAVMFYNPNGSSQPWVSGAGAGYTSTDSWAGGVFHSMSLAHDRIRVLGFAGYGDAKLKFYGIGPDAGDAGVYVNLEDKAIMALGDAQMRIFKNKGFLGHIYAGVRLEYLDIDSIIEIPHPGRPDLSLPAIELDSRIVSIGPSFTFDTRDSSLNPRKGIYVTGNWLFGADFLGSDFEYDKLMFAANAYFPLGKTTTLGIRKSMCGVSGNAPFYDICMFGQQGDLRGYETGRYRDGASWALQAEVRQHLFGRFGAVAFAGVGGIADSTGDILKHSTVLTSGGAGIRYLASPRNNVNLRLDVAFGKDGSAVYFGIGEAF